MFTGKAKTGREETILRVWLLSECVSSTHTQPAACEIEIEREEIPASTFRRKCLEVLPRQDSGKPWENSSFSDENE